MDREELQDWMARVHKDLNTMKRLNGGAWDPAQSVKFTSQEVEAILSALEIAGEM